jgi:NADPH:quinone reductase-like Zn-dependent oxidoreductase
MIEVEAWVLYQGEKGLGSKAPAFGELRNELFSFSDLNDDEVLVEPIYGCWEGNMTHAVERSPIDICRQRGEEKVVIGNTGVARILKTGAAVRTLKEGDLCLVFPNGVWDELGFMVKALAYDAPGTVGVLAKRTKLLEKHLIRIPQDTRFDLRQWAAFPGRYITAWANWKVAYGCLRLQLPEAVAPSPFVFGWGGGSTLAEVLLAKHAGCEAALISSRDRRLKLIAELGVAPIDRRQFKDLNYDQGRYQSDPAFREAYLAAEKNFLNLVNEHTRGAGVSIFVDYIGLPVHRATLKALARPGVITTAGWKRGMQLSHLRAVECMSWHTHVNTHFARYADGLEAVQFAEETGWIPPIDGEVTQWDNIPQLARDHAEDNLGTYFPLYQVNPL